ncbi:RNA polymerase II transcription factor B subunit 1 [Quaeritorhiza haematococci]|nr:RNA polymerase II transcription factor B subunit 1 [Quaeritorhiza haematococci]
MQIQVSFKKTPGVLAVASKSLSWTPAGDSNAKLIIPYESIKAQHVNLPGSGKVLLKITTWAQGSTPETSYNFTFTSSSAAAEREKVKDRLAEVIGQQRGSTPVSRPSSPAVSTGGGSSGRGVLSQQEIQARQTLLSKNKELAKLHRQLVIGGVITEEDFWENRKFMLVNQTWQASQKKGTPSEWSVDIKPTTSSEGSDMVVTLNAETIHSIFIHFPAVAKAYKDNVPDKMTEKEFWKQYFVSKFYHRQRGVVMPADGKEDLFDKYLEPEGEVQGTTYNKLLDLESTSEDHVKGFGNKPDMTMLPGGVKSAVPLIKQFNRHGEVVLKETRKSIPVPSIEEVYEKETVLEDLAPGSKSGTVPLDIQDPTKYFEVLGSEGGEDLSTSTLEVRMGCFSVMCD